MSSNSFTSQKTESSLENKVNGNKGGIPKKKRILTRRQRVHCTDTILGSGYNVKSNIEKRDKTNHVAPQDLHLFASHKMVTGLPQVVVPEVVCKECTGCKKTSRTNSRTIPTTATEKLEVIHSVVCGPIQTETPGGNRKIWIYLKGKHEVLDVFKKFKCLAEKHNGKMIKVLTTDSGRGYMSSEFKEFCESKGIIHEVISPYTPQHSGTIEKRNRTLLNLVRCMLKGKNLPNFLWGEAVSTTTYIMNKSPTRRVEDKTLEKAWTRAKLNVAYLRTFGLVLYKQDHELFQDLVVNLEEELVHFALIVEAEPVEFDRAATKEKWVKAMKKEINSIELVDRPSNKKPIALKWVYKVKVNPRGEVVKYKAKLVAKGFLQKAGIDYGEVYAPVARIETIRLVVAIVTNANWYMHQLDVKSAFLNGPLEEEGFVVKGEENKMYKPKKALYGLKQILRAWNRRIDSYLSLIGFKKCTSKHGVYVKCWKDSMKSEKLLVCLYVDDLLIIGSYKEAIIGLERQLMNEFEMSDLGLLSYFLGIEFKMTRYDQSKYAKDLLKRLNMKQSNPVDTLVEVHAKANLLAAKRILRCVQGTIDFGILLLNGEADTEPDLVGYFDSNWYGDKSDRKSTTGYIFLYRGAPIYWSSTKEPVVALSSCEAKYIVTSETLCQVAWLDALMKDLQVEDLGKIKLLVDKKSSIDLARHLAAYGRSKHIETRFHFLREQVSTKKLRIEHCRTEIQFVDILTNTLKLERCPGQRSVSKTLAGRLLKLTQMLTGLDLSQIDGQHQNVVTRSSDQADYRAIAQGLCDNKAAISIAQMIKLSMWRFDSHFINEKVDEGNKGERLKDNEIFMIL
ncbi:Copia protein, partial [Mucuna pruriens]